MPKSMCLTKRDSVYTLSQIQTEHGMLYVLSTGSFTHSHLHNAFYDAALSK